jgi:phosphate transport system substrate-binding protein
MSMFTRILALGLVAVAGASPAIAQEKLKGQIKCDGSSTVYLITEAMASRFKKIHPDVNITVGIAGTGGGFKKFAAGETDIQDASRNIKPAEEENLKKAGIEYVKIQVAWDGISVVINKDNTWAQKMTVEQLKKIWHPDMAAKKWSDVDPAWPAERIDLYGPGPDSGTFDFFTEAINGKEKLTRSDFTPSEDDNVLVAGVARNKYAMGYFGMAYYEANKDKLAVVHIAAKNGDPFVAPNDETVLKNTYKPLSRPLYIFIKKTSLERPEVKEFVKYYLDRTNVVGEVKYVRLSALQHRMQSMLLKKAIGE